MEAKEGLDSADPRKLMAEDLTKRRSERGILLEGLAQLDSSLRQKNMRLEPQRPSSFTGLPKDIEVLGLESNTLFPFT